VFNYKGSKSFGDREHKWNSLTMWDVNRDSYRKYRENTIDYFKEFEGAAPVRRMRRALQAVTNLQKYTSGEEMAREICSKNSAMFCDESGMMPSIIKICNNFDFLPADVKTSTSMRTICAADIKKMCNDASISPLICPDKSTVLPSLCGLYPDKCMPLSSSFDSCAQNFFECIIKPEWDFCSSFGDLCFQTGATQGSYTGSGATTTTTMQPTVKVYKVAAALPAGSKAKLNADGTATPAGSFDMTAVPVAYAIDAGKEVYLDADGKLHEYKPTAGSYPSTTTYPGTTNMQPTTKTYKVIAALPAGSMAKINADGTLSMAGPNEANTIPVGSDLVASSEAYIGADGKLHEYKPTAGSYPSTTTYPGTTTMQPTVKVYKVVVALPTGSMAKINTDGTATLADPKDTTAVPVAYAIEAGKEVYLDADGKLHEYKPTDGS